MQEYLAGKFTTQERNLNRFSIAFGFIVGLISWLVASTIEVLRQVNTQTHNEMCERIIGINYETFVKTLNLADREFRGLEIQTKEITGDVIVPQYDNPLDRIGEDLNELRFEVEKRYHESLIDIIHDHLFVDPEDVFKDLSERLVGITDQMNEHQKLLNRKPGDRSGIKTIS